ncbi:type II secretion system F family protein [Pseudohongiella sp.]|uniref:Type II secretion system protein GspF domain-containing protein n=1 Tax=marine sediment metagenome TaxID=412755 RepID=A0A0F9YIR3_9ZZZZ|nr:type II secretion system F family protein [Pseudohongiella sp.]HDZ09342.1 type II secretion system F family protein [Pseudohongiella sp.]HEA63809.1 type II secretion system F family protein [Pseudohongiella sp.]
MPVFQYKARNSAGALISGAVDAATLDAAAGELLEQGMTPIDIKAGRSGRGRIATPQESARPRPAVRKGAGTKPPESGLQQLNDALMRKKIDITELIIFSRQMQSLTKAGLPLDRALTGLRGSMKNPRLKQLIGEVLADLESGQSLSTALGHHPKVFSPLFLSLVDVGENTGRLDLAFEQISRYLELEKSTRKQVKSATRYPIFVISTMAVALGIITYFVIPAFSQTFARLGAELPLETRILIGISDFVVNWWQFLLGGTVAAVVGFKTWVRSRRGKLIWDHQKLKIPLAGPVFNRIALARFSRTFAMILKAGVPIVHGMGVVAGAVGNKFIAGRILRMRDGISRGESLYNTAVTADMFSPLILQMIAVGEESGTIDQLLEEVADFYDAEVEYDLKRLGEVIEPILIMFIAGMVLVLALGVFLPIWDLSSAVNN